MTWHLVAVAATFIYMIPAFVAENKKREKLIQTVITLTGWTIIGWVATLIWAIKAEKIKDVPECPGCGK
jgi:hypothetical protein